MSKLSDFLVRFPDYAKWLDAHDEEVIKKAQDRMARYLKKSANISLNEAYKKACEQLISDIKSGKIK